jgi:hypothetical protein
MILGCGGGGSASDTATPNCPVCESGFETKMIGKWRAITVPEASFYPVKSIFEFNASSKAYSITIPAVYAEGEIISSLEKYSGVWGSEKGILKIDEREYAYDLDDSNTISSDEIDLEDNSDDVELGDYYWYSLTFSGNKMTIFDPVFQETYELEKV